MFIVESLFRVGMGVIHIGNVNPAESRAIYNNMFAVTETVTTEIFSKKRVRKVDGGASTVHLTLVLMFLHGSGTDYVAEVLIGA